jgi:hypothetical protein
MQSRPTEWPRNSIDDSPQDEFKPEWDFSGFVVLAQFALDVARDVANAEGLPTWNSGDEFRPARDKLGVK